MAKETFVELYAPSLEAKRNFEIRHASRILQIVNGGWELPDDSKYELVNDELKLKTNKRTTDKSEQE